MAADKKKTKRRSPGTGGLFKRGDGMWTGAVEIKRGDGSRYSKRVYSKDYRIAKQKFEELKASVDEGYIPVTSSTTVAKWLEHWLEDIKRPNVSQNTYQFYEEAVRLHINPHIGHRPLGTLVTAEIRKVINGANTTRNAQRIHMVLNMALKVAVSDRVLRHNAAEPIEKPGHTATERDAMTAADAIQVIRTAIRIQERTAHMDDVPKLATRWAAAFLTGGRPAELRGLEWDRVDFGKGVFDLSWQLQQGKQQHGCLDDDGNITCGHSERVGYCPDRYWKIAAGREYRECYRSMLWVRPKTLAGKRIVPIPAPLLGMLELHARDTAIEPNPHNLVWHHRDGRPIYPTDENEQWHDLIDDADLPQIEQYATRHTTATLLESLGVPADVRMQIMGQSSKVAHQAYVHVDQSRTRPALDKLAQLLA